MGKTVHVYSKLANNQNYTIYKEQAVGEGNEFKQVQAQILIRGGAGLADKNLVTPLGIHTEVTEEEAAALQQNHVFKLHHRNGHISMQARNTDVEKVVGDMGDQTDPSAPITPASFEEVDEDTTAIPESIRSTSAGVRAPSNGRNKKR
jgi:hypothetical protein